MRRRFFRQGVEGAHIVEAVGEFDDDHPDVIGNAQEHLAEILGLLLLFALELDAADLGDAVDEADDLRGEFIDEQFFGNIGVSRISWRRPAQTVGVSIFSSVRVSAVW
ncbi:MAG: hypothetical protein U5N26_06055 [Candidatus Marinimicrobia bacterium]|nr:hypothetical protein [Candidatus Neomarinimicrobiota bacterium]